MEDTLGVKGRYKYVTTASLNPCFNGRYSRSLEFPGMIEEQYDVLILVLMEDTLGGRKENIVVLLYIGLNPCFNGRYSRRAKTYISLFIAV